MDERRAEQPTLALVSELAGQLKAAGILYCHWKSNEALDRSASGDNDLDLLIARRDAPQFTAILHAMGFRCARPPHARQLPGVIDYYGLDEASGRIVHVHAHFQLVLGDDMTKNFRLPIEDAYLGSVRSDGVLPVPAPAFEYLVFVLRMVVKHATLDAQIARRGRLSASEQRELAFLDERIDRDAVTDLLARNLPVIDRQLFDRCRAVIGDDASRLERAAVAQRVLHRLSSLGRHSAFGDLVLRIWRRQGRKFDYWVRGGAPRKRLVTGGVIVALIGGDGAGKSSAVAMISDLLSDDFVTAHVHLGRPPRSLLSRLARRVLEPLRGQDPSHPTRRPAWDDGSHQRFPGHVFMVWHVLVARDRYLAYRRARRMAMRGAIVICDRYPLTQLRTMDGPRTTSALVGRRPVARLLAHAERSYYRRMLPPDLLVVLRVDPDVAVGRCGDGEAFVRQRAGEVYSQDWSSTRAVVVDAGQPIEDAWSDIRSAIWSVL